MALPRRRQFRFRQGGDGWRVVRRILWALVLAGMIGGGFWWWSKGRMGSYPVALTPSVATSSVDATTSSAPVSPPPLPPVGATLLSNVIRNEGIHPAIIATNPPARPGILVSTNIVRQTPPSAAALIGESPEDVAALRGPAGQPVRATNWLLAQIALVARGISPGSIDGIGGAQSAEALRAFQADAGLEPHGRLDPETIQVLTFEGPAFSEYVVSPTDLAQLHPLPSSWLGKSEVESLGYESLVELVGELTQAHPNFLRRLNPGVDWEHPRAGLRLTIPLAHFPAPRPAALIRISLGKKWLRVFDARGRLIAHFPCSIAARVEKRPVGDLRVAVAVRNPNYTFDPAVFPESAEGRVLGRKLVLNPGPNNPVGVAWIGLNRTGYGIHGTPLPELVGRTESHGCFRLANWNAEYLRQMCWVGLRVSVVP